MVGTPLALDSVQLLRVPHGAQVRRTPLHHTPPPAPREVWGERDGELGPRPPYLHEGRRMCYACGLLFTDRAPPLPPPNRRPPLPPPYRFHPLPPPQPSSRRCLCHWQG